MFFINILSKSEKIEVSNSSASYILVKVSIKVVFIVAPSCFCTNVCLLSMP